MARIKISLPEKTLFVTEIPVRITDINYGGHVGNDSVLSIIHEARILFLKHFGFSEFDFGGVGLIMADSAIEYVKEIFYGDVLRIKIGIEDISRISFDIVYLFEVKKEDAWVTVTKAKTGMVCFNYDFKKVSAIPEEALLKLTK